MYESTNKHNTPNDTLPITKEDLDFIKNTLYTQTMYAEFEKKIHELVEENKNINECPHCAKHKERSEKEYKEQYAQGKEQYPCKHGFGGKKHTDSATNTGKYQNTA